MANGTDGCDGSSRFRSHGNDIKIAIAISMILKAGVPNNKVYGPATARLPKSGARPGECTKTPDYIANAEMNERLDSDDKEITTYFDEGSKSMISTPKMAPGSLVTTGKTGLPVYGSGVKVAISLELLYERLILQNLSAKILMAQVQEQSTLLTARNPLIIWMIWR